MSRSWASTPANSLHASGDSSVDLLKPSRRRLLEKLVAGGFLTLGLPRALNALGGMPSDRDVYRIRGYVTINGTVATEQSRIKAGDTIETGANSEIVFIVGSDAYLLRSRSRLQLGGSGGVVSLLRILTGKILSVYGRGNRVVRTRTATIGIRGTGAYVEAEENRTYLCTCYGTVDMAALRDESVKETVTTTHHESPRYIINLPDGGARIEPAPVINHTDEELILLESLVGRVPQFTTAGEY